MMHGNPRGRTLMVGVVSVADLLDNRVESAVLVRVILDDALSAVSFVQSVLALDDISIAGLPLALVVASVAVFDSVLKLVRGMRVEVGVVVVMPVVSRVVMSMINGVVVTVRFCGSMMSMRLASMSMWLVVVLHLDIISVT
jgi:hypothetical protein